MKGKLRNRLSRAEGQIKGVKDKLDTEQSPDSIVQQVKAARNAVHKVGEEVLREYYRKKIVSALDPGTVFDEYVACSNKLRS